jgi:hypothetical protein
MKSWSYTVAHPLGSRETIEAPTEQEARNIIFERHGSRRIYPVAGRWGVAIESVN